MVINSNDRQHQTDKAKVTKRIRAFAYWHTSMNKDKGRAAFKHKKTGKKVFVSSLAICESDLSVMVLYIEKSGVIWVRPLKEFIDGRFEKITDD